MGGTACECVLCVVKKAGRYLVICTVRRLRHGVLSGSEQMGPLWGHYGILLGGYFGSVKYSFSSDGSEEQPPPQNCGMQPRAAQMSWEPRP